MLPVAETTRALDLAKVCVDFCLTRDDPGFLFVGTCFISVLFAEGQAESLRSDF